MLEAGQIVRLVLVQQQLDQVVNNIWDYVLDGPVPDTVSIVNVAEAWWDVVKGTWRAIRPSNFPAGFLSVRASVLSEPEGELGEYPIPIADRLGTRSPFSGDAAQAMPAFNAGRVRLTVATRATRPGQKRIAHMSEGDQSEGVLTATYSTAVNAAMAVTAANIALGSPALLVGLIPVVTSATGTPLVVSAFQPITGHVLNPRVGSQVSRRPK